MEIFGGFMVMVSIIGLFLAVVWLIMPFVVIAMKGKQDRSLEVLETIETRLAAMEVQIKQCAAEHTTIGPSSASAAGSNETEPHQNSQPPALPLA